MPSIVATDSNQAGGDFHRQPATFDNPAVRYSRRYVKGAPFFNGRYTKEVPFPSDWYIKG